MSVDTYIDATLADAKGILIRPDRRRSYWSLRPEPKCAILAQRRGIALAVLPGDGREDTQLDAFSTLPISTLRRLSALCDAGGRVWRRRQRSHNWRWPRGLYAGPVQGEKNRSRLWLVRSRTRRRGRAGLSRPSVVVVTFYRSYLTAADTGPVDALIGAFRSRRFEAIGLFVPSLKTPGANRMDARRASQAGPGRDRQRQPRSPRAATTAPPRSIRPIAPVFQVALSTARKRDWAASERGLSAADLAMHVVLPELDGRIFVGVTSFKSPGKRDPDLQYSRFAHRADSARIEAVADRVGGWHRLATNTGARTQAGAGCCRPNPGRADQMAHAVGLDALASTEAILSDLATEGYAIADGLPLASELSLQTLAWPVHEYRAALARLPEPLQTALAAAWGARKLIPPCTMAHSISPHSIAAMR